MSRQFEYKPLEKSAKKQIETEGKIRKALHPLDPIILPIQAGYEKIKPVPVIGPVAVLLVRILTIFGAFSVIAIAIVLILVLGIMAALWMNDLAGPQAPDASSGG